MDPLDDPKLLPSQAFTTAAALLESVDKNVLVSLRDGRKLYGILRSFDQFANLVLQDTIERIIIDGSYGEEPRGVYIVRGENVALLGEFEPELARQLEETKAPGSLASMTRVPYSEMQNRWNTLIEEKKKNDLIQSKKLKKLGITTDTYQDNLY